MILNPSEVWKLSEGVREYGAGYMACEARDLPQVGRVHILPSRGGPLVRLELRLSGFVTRRFHVAIDPGARIPETLAEAIEYGFNEGERETEGEYAGHRWAIVIHPAWTGLFWPENVEAE